MFGIIARGSSSPLHSICRLAEAPHDPRPERGISRDGSGALHGIGIPLSLGPCMVFLGNARLNRDGSRSRGHRIGLLVARSSRY